MPENEPLSTVSLNALAYWRDDGIPALIVGVGYTIVVASMLTLFSIGLKSSPDSNWNWLTGSLMVLWLPGAFVFSVWLANNYEDIVEWIKVRITYPRTGYVAPPSYWNHDAGKPTLASGAIYWSKLYPVRHEAFQILTFCAYLISLTWWMPVVPGWLNYFSKAVWPWMCAAVSLFFMSSRAPDYMRKLKANKLYWIQILSLPVYLALLVWLSSKSVLWNLALVELLPFVMSDYVSKMRMPRLHWMEVVGIALYLVPLAWLMKKDAGWGMVVVLLTPGIYLILKGAVRLIRFLYLHPVPQAS